MSTVFNSTLTGQVRLSAISEGLLGLLGGPLPPYSALELMTATPDTDEDHSQGGYGGTGDGILQG